MQRKIWAESSTLSGSISIELSPFLPSCTAQSGPNAVGLFERVTPFPCDSLYATDALHINRNLPAHKPLPGGLLEQTAHARSSTVSTEARPSLVPGTRSAGSDTCCIQSVRLSLRTVDCNVTLEGLQAEPSPNGRRHNVGGMVSCRHERTSCAPVTRASCSAAAGPIPNTTGIRRVSSR